MKKQLELVNTKNQMKLKKKRTLKAIENLCLLDDYLMSLVFDRNIEATEFLLNVILRRNDLNVLEVIAQREYKNPIPGGRSITLDIYAADESGKIYNIEVQRAPVGADAHRARFHSSMIDTKMLKTGQEFHEIHDSYVIFITANDVIGSGCSLYHINRIIEETGTYFGDGSHIIYVNGSYKNNSDPVGKLMHDFRCSSSVDMFYPILAKHVKYFKETEGGQSVMRKTFRELAKEYAEEFPEDFMEEIAVEKAEKLAIEKAEKLVAEKAEKLAIEKAEKLAIEKAEKLAIEKAEKLAIEKAEKLAAEKSEKRIAEEKIALARRMITRGKLTVEEIAEDADLPLEVVRNMSELRLV
ncbi:MAG: hypothetical protein HFG80_13035 [Eubacterium sp.]|nr:hypothetical protein [Eubacterium sp.]